MVINTAIIQHRRGSLDDFNPEKLTPGELAVITDERSVYMGFPGGEAEKIVLEKDFTSESIKEKLGYEPADEERVDQLFRDKADYQYVDKKVSNVKVDLTGYAKEDYVDDEIEELNKKIVQETGKLSNEIAELNGDLANKEDKSTIITTKLKHDNSKIKYSILESNDDVFDRDFVMDESSSFNENCIKNTVLNLKESTDFNLKCSTIDVYDVRDYGAKGDGENDDTSAIQLAIDTCFENGGGIVFLPQGKYNLKTVHTRNGKTSHLFIPMIDKLTQRKTIRLVGTTCAIYPSFYIEFGTGENNPNLNGSTLLSTYIPSEGTITSPISVISSERAKNFTNCNFTRLQIEHLNIATSVLRSEGYPKVSGIDASNIASVSLKDVLVGTNIGHLLLKAPPTDHISYGIAMPKDACDPNQILEEVCVAGGYKYGVICTEHVNGVNVNLQNCIYGFVFSGTAHPNYFSHVTLHGCKYQIATITQPFDNYHEGISNIKFEMLDFEENVNQEPIDFNYSSGVYDPNNSLRGKVEYFMVKSNVGATDADWTVVGAENLDIKSLN